jgi:hypothetical protein
MQPVSTRDGARLVHALCESCLNRVERAGATGLVPSGSRCSSGVSCALLDQLPLVLSEAGEHPRHHPPRGRREVDVLAERPEDDASFL